MVTPKKMTGAAIAVAVAVSFSAMPALSVSANGNNDVVMCVNANACRGQGECKMTTDSCKYINKCRGQNACEGKGFLMLSKVECVKRGGHGIIRTIPPNAVGSLPVKN
jgi:hypothetical protein